MGPTEADDKQPLGCINRAFISLPFFSPHHKNYFTLSPEQGLRYFTTLFWNLCQGKGLPLLKAQICRIWAKAKSFTKKNLSPCLVMCSREYRNNTDEALKNKPAEPEKHWKLWQKSSLSQ